MPVVSLKEIVDRSFAERYGVPAINVFNDLTLEAVLAGAVAAQSPVIVQTSVKTVKSIGVEVLAALWRAETRDISVPVALHLDHCPDRAVVSACLENGWNSVLFDASELPVEENQRQTIEVVAEAGRYGAHVEGEIESITGVEDDHGSDEESARQSLDVQLRIPRCDRSRCLRTRDRQRARDVQSRASARRPAHHGHRGSSIRFPSRFTAAVASAMRSSGISSTADAPR